MRYRHLCVMLAVASVVAACKSKANPAADSTVGGSTGDTGGVVTPPPPPPPQYDVTITFNCEGEDSVAIGIRPYRYELRKNGKIKWGLESKQLANVKLKPMNGANWPFPGGSEVVVQRGVATEKTRGSGNSSAPQLHYQVTGICPRTNGADTIVVDPIMILPN